METSLLGPTTRIIWYDPNVNNDENVSYFQKFFSQTEIERFSNYEKVVQWIDENPGRWIIITSGNKGRKLLEFVHGSEKVLGVVIFCRDKKLHEEWAKSYPIVKKVATDIKEVVPEVEKLFQRYLLKGVLQVPPKEKEYDESSAIRKILITNSQKEDDIVTDPEETVFHHFRKEDQVKFEFVVRLLLEDNYHSYPNEILNELKRLNPKDEEDIERLFKERELQDLLGAIFYLYSTIYIYRPMNKKFGAQAYDELAYTLSACVHEVMERPDLKIDPTKKLYRGLHRRSHGNNYIVDDETIFWPAFTSTTLDIKKAEKFAGDGGIIFEISLSQTNPYLNVLLKEGWSQFSEEKEVLLFPHFAMKVKSKEVYGSRILICVEQDENERLLSLSRSELSEKWKEFVNKSVKSNYEVSFELIRSKILGSSQLRDALSMLMGNKALNNLLRSSRFQKKPDQMKGRLIGMMIQIFRKDLERKSYQLISECKVLQIDSLAKEVSIRLAFSYYQFLGTEMEFVFERIAVCFIQEAQKNSNEGILDRFIRLISKSSLPKIVITKTLQDVSIDWSPLDEKIKAWITQELDKIKPELISRAERYWEWKKNHRPNLIVC